MLQVPRGPFVGRERELAAVERGLARARAGISALVTILGAGGIGKTRLAEEAVERAKGFSVAWGSGWPDAGAPPLWPWQAVLEQLGASDAVELLDQHEATTEPERFARFRAVSQAIASVAADRPVAIVLDDAHYVDAGALLLARFVVRTLRNAPLLVIVASRPNPSTTAETVAEVARDGILVDLAGLGIDDVGAIVASAGAGGPARLGPALHALTSGNPFLVHEALAGSDNDLAVLDRAGRRLGERLDRFDAASLLALGAGAILGPSTDTAIVGRVADVTAAELRKTYDVAVQEGVLRPPPAQPYTFVHDLLREAVLGRLRGRELSELHGRAADELSSSTAPESPDQAARIAQHRLAAADANDPDAVSAAVEASRTAARVYRDGLAYEAAAVVLGDARALLERAGAPVPADLLLEHANAELAGGRLAAARRSFLAAVADDGPIEPAVLAEAAVGLGGIWVAEHRALDARDRYHALLERAVAELGTTRPDLRARLDARISAEAIYAGERSLDAMLAAVDAARSLDDPLPLAEALSLLHHVMLGPTFAPDRLEIADELIDVGTAAGAAVLALMGVLWRTVDLLLAGDPGAERSLLELRQRADGLRVEAVLFVVEVLDVMRTLRAGRVEDAEAAAARALEHGLAVGDADAINYYSAHLLAIRWLQNRSEEVLPLARDALDGSTMVAGDPAFAAALAALAADAGGAALEEAQRQLDHLVDLGLDAIPPSSNWFATMFCIVEAASVLGDARAARAAYDELAPYADLPAMGSIAVVCFGPVARVLGKAARTLGRIDDAVAHFEHAEGVARRIGNRPFLALTRADLGDALLSRGDPADADRARSLVEDADAALRRLGLASRADRITAAIAAHPGVALESPSGTCRYVDGWWEVASTGEAARVADGVGMRHLARLLAAPRVAIGADELAGAEVAAARHEVVDNTALATYRRRVAVLQEEADAADRRGDAARSEAVERELDELLAHISGVTGLGGRPRAFADARERARTSVQKAIRRSLATIAAQAPGLGDLLTKSIHTGLVCRFDPVEGLPADWRVSARASARASTSDA